MQAELSHFIGDPSLLWCRPAASAPVRPLAWEPPHAVGAALKTKNKEFSPKQLCANPARFSVSSLSLPLSSLPLSPRPLFFATARGGLVWDLGTLAVVVKALSRSH